VLSCIPLATLLTLASLCVSRTAITLTFIPARLARLKVYPLSVKKKVADIDNMRKYNKYTILPNLN
jgi:hypothetical protein